MHLASLCNSLLHIVRKPRVWSRNLPGSRTGPLPDSDRFRNRAHGRLWSHPDNVVDIHIVRENSLPTSIEVQHSRVKRLVYTPEIQEGTLLTELVIIAPVICRSIGIARKNRYATLPGHSPEQFGTPVYINLFAEHFFVNLNSAKRIA